MESLWFATLSKNQRHKIRDRLPSTTACPCSLPGNGDKWIEIVYGEGKKIFCTGRTGAAKNLFCRHDKPNKPTMERPRSFVLLESPLASVSTVCRGHPSLVSINLRLVLMKSHFSGLDPRQQTLTAISSEKTVIRKAWRQHKTFLLENLHSSLEPPYTVQKI